MKRLPEVINRKGFTYTLMHREDNTALYSQYDNQHEQVVAYEVFIIPIQKPQSVQLKDGTCINYEEKEKLPKDEDFGKFAFSYMGTHTEYKKAYQKLIDLEQYKKRKDRENDRIK